MKKLIAVLFAIAMLDGCTHIAVDHNEMVMPDGRKGHSVTCNAQYDQYCHKRMGEECPNGYQVTGTTSGRVGSASMYFVGVSDTTTYYFICR